MTALRRAVPLLFAALGASTAGAAASGPQDPPREEVQRLEAWPSLSPERERTVQKDVERLRKARTEEMGEEARAALIEAGAGAVPHLLPKLGKERDAEARARMVAVLEAVTGAAHTRLLAREFADRSPEVRTWALRRAAAFPDPGIREPALQAWKRAAGLAEKHRVDEDELAAAALAATSSGSVQALAHLCALAEEDWGELGAAIRTAAEAVRGPEATEVVAARLRDADAARQVACLRVLAGCGDRESAPPHVAPFLSTEHSQLRVAAINACRGIVDGDPPLERLSAFDAIERARKWSQRI